MEENCGGVDGDDRSGSGILFFRPMNGNCFRVLCLQVDRT